MSADRRSRAGAVSTEPSVEEIEAGLDARRQQLASDLEVLGARLSPTALKAQAGEAGQQAVAQARSRAEALRGDVTARVQGLLGRDGAAGSPDAGTAGPDGGASPTAASPTAASAYGFVPGPSHADAAGGTTAGEAVAAGTGGKPGPDGGAGARDGDDSQRVPWGRVFEPSTARHAQVRLQRLLDDARDGDPASLAVVTGAVLALTGLSVAAVVRAVRR